MRNARTLTRAQLRELAAELERERARVEARLAAEERSDDTLADVAGHRADRLDADARSGFGLATQSRARMRYDAILAALGRMSDGSYGSCAACGSEIPFGRLLVMPETPYCVACGPRG